MNRNAVTEQTQCFHCGNDCVNETLFFDEKSFCCLGCKSVYQVLNDNNLCSYYSYNQHPGSNRADTVARFDYLDDPTITKELVDYIDHNITIVSFYIPAIHCSSCLWLLEQLNKMNPAIYYSRVDFLKKQLIVRFDNKATSLKQVVELLYNIGYEPVIRLQDVIKEQAGAKKDNLVQKIAVAGFCFGNVMLLSFPEYFGLSVFEQSFKHFFGWLNLAFALPVVFYSGREYFISAWNSLRAKVLNIDFPLALGITVMFIRSVAEVITHSGAGFTDTLCGLVFFLLIGKFVQKKTYHHISFERDYRSFFPVAVQVLEDDIEQCVPLSQLTTGQRIVIRHNEIVPADAILLKGKALVDFSFVTGESVPVNKILGEIVYAGGRQVGDAIELEVVKAVSQSYLTQLWNNEAFTRKQANRVRTFSEKVSKYFTFVLLGIAFGSLIFWLNSDVSRAIAAFTAVLIVACPCALALSTPFTMSAALSILDKNLFYLKNIAVVEQLASVDTIVLDKTGTITTGDGNQVQMNSLLTDEDKQLIYSACINSIHPLSRMICQYLGQLKRVTPTYYAEQAGKGIEAIVDGHRILAGSAKFVFGRDDIPASGARVFLKIDDIYHGYFTFEQRYRTGLEEVARLGKDYNLQLLSGDQDHEQAALTTYFCDAKKMHFGQSPQDKLDFIKSLQEQGHKIMMIGDGLNDSGALKQSDFGIAITDNVNNFSPGSDAILDGKAFAKLPAFIKFSKTAVRIIHFSFLISLTYNVVGLSYAVTGKLSPLVAAILMPLSTATIISFTTIATHLAAKKQKLL